MKNSQNKILLEAINSNDMTSFDLAVLNGSYISFNSDEPLRMAVYNGHIEMVKKLIDLGARINIKNSILIVLAVQNKFHNIVEYLFENHINFIKRTDLIISIAKKNNDHEMVLLLEKYFLLKLGNYGVKKEDGYYNEYYYKEYSYYVKEKLPRSSSVSNQKIQELIKGFDISTLIAKYIKIESNNKKYKNKNIYAICPFHKEKTPSFCISKERVFFHCFGCGESGNAINFLMKYEKISFIKAVRKISNIRGIKIKP